MTETQRIRNPRICQFGATFEAICREAVRMAGIAKAIEAALAAEGK